MASTAEASLRGAIVALWAERALGASFTREAFAHHCERLGIPVSRLAAVADECVAHVLSSNPMPRPWEQLAADEGKDDGADKPE